MGKKKNRPSREGQKDPSEYTTGTVTYYKSVQNTKQKRYNELAALFDDLYRT